jgi:transposase
LWFADEARFGQQGTTTRIWAQRGQRAEAIRQTEFEWVYLYGAVDPRSGRSHGWMFPEVNTATMNSFLETFSRQLAPAEHALMVLDRAGWHRSRALVIPPNVTLLYLPPYSPQLNPSELLWWQMRDRHLSNRRFAGIPDLERAVAHAWSWLVNRPDFLRSLCLFPWIESAVVN